MSSRGDVDSPGDLASPSASRPWKWIAAVIAVLVVIGAGVAIAASSGSSGASPRPSDSSVASLQSYLAKADAICSNMNPQIYTAIQNVSTAEGQNSASAATSALHSFSQLGQKEVGQIRALAQPSQDSGLVKRFYSVDTDMVRAQLAAVAPGARAAASLHASQDVIAVHQLAAQIGFTSCSQTENVAQH